MARRVESLADYTRQTRRVVKLCGNGEYREALAILEDLLERRFHPPDLRDLWIEVAGVQGKLGRSAEALAALEEAIALERDTQVYKAARAKAAYLADLGRHRESLVLFEQIRGRRDLRTDEAAEIDGEIEARKRALGSASARDFHEDFARAVKLEADGDRGAAIRIFEHLLEQPFEAMDRIVVLINIAILHSLEERVDEALSAYDRAVAVEASHWGYWALTSKAGYLHRIGRLEQSADLFEAVLARSDVQPTHRETIQRNVQTIREDLAREA